MNALAVFTVNEHLEQLMDEAARRRMVVSSGPSLRERISARVDALVEAIDRAVDLRPRTVKPLAR